jgi:hypothetical protein
MKRGIHSKLSHFIVSFCRVATKQYSNRPPRGGGNVSPAEEVMSPLQKTNKVRQLYVTLCIFNNINH